MMNVIYMDNNATTRIAPEILETMMPYLTEFYGNASSMHSFGGQVGRAIAEAREKVAALINADPAEIIFTSCGTESDSTAVFSAIRSQPDKKHLITTRVEHPAIKNLFEYLAKTGYRVTWVPVDGEGVLDLDYLKDHLSDDTALVSVMWANNETGVMFPVDEIGDLLGTRGIMFHSDAVQAVGKIPVDVKAAGLDMMSLSGHKIHAPKGVGALYLKKGTRFSPFMIGGHQEKNRRGGTENTAAVIGLGKACEMAAGHLAEMNTRVRAMRDRLEDGLLSAIPNALLNGKKDGRLPNTANISFEYIEGEAILLMMDQLGICASSGSACTSGSLEPSHVLRAMGVPFTASHGSIRFSLSTYNTEAEVDFVVGHLPPIIQRLREMSPFWQQGVCRAQ